MFLNISQLTVLNKEPLYFCIVKRSYYYLLATLLCAQAWISFAYAQEKVTVEGFISNEKGIRIPLVNIVNITNHTGTTCDVDGQFRIPSNPGDTLKFSAVGFMTLRYIVRPVNDSPILPVHLIMDTDTLQLSTVTIYAWPGTSNALKKAILEMEPEVSNQPDLHLEIPLSQDRLTNLIHPNVSNPIPGTAPMAGGISVPAPWQVLYDRFSKQGKSLKKRDELEHRQTMHERALCYYNPELIRQITRFKTDEEIEEFMTFCNISDEFVLYHTEYELLCAIRDCYLAYNDALDN